MFLLFYFFSLQALPSFFKSLQGAASAIQVHLCSANTKSQRIVRQAFVSAPTRLKRATMGVAVFNNGYLLVGERVKDWSEVWYKPEGMGNEVGISLHSSSTPDPDDEEARAPMRGEVKWFTQFDVKNMESTEKKEREVMQKQTLYDAWCYMHEMNPKEVRALERDFNKPNERRWQSWFMHAVRAKRLQFLRAAQADGGPVLPGDDIDNTLFGAEFEKHMQQTIRKRGLLMQPPRRGPIKRKGTAATAPSRKRQRAASDDSSQDGEEPTMSGGSGNFGDGPLLDPSHDRTKPNGMDYLLGGMSKGSRYSNEPEEMSDDDDATEAFSECFDASPPEAPRSAGMGSISSPSSGLGNGLTGMAARRLAQRNGPGGPGAPPKQPPHARMESVLDEEFRTNGGLSDEAALERAMRASVQPDEMDTDLTNGGLPDDIALEHIIRASMQPEALDRMRAEIRASLDRESETEDAAETQQDDIEDPDEPEEAEEGD